MKFAFLYIYTTLGLAIDTGNIDIVKLLISHPDFDVNLFIKAISNFYFNHITF